ncbi:virulence membrane protein PagC [Xenorhabdus mauleonii]|uniref:Putatice virulence related protein PagC n=2 Tax=Xenorhabdus mauleonii TaxID=351675 RepID=A0A1I3IXD6_9GAMM|nr:virulence membrane protein PagC [Xenorhabdus mauleonii]SFI52525.1 putatice virulence related protein PagC [Xenorhabdus mauleonii]
MTSMRESSVAKIEEKQRNNANYIYKFRPEWSMLKTSLIAPSYRVNHYFSLYGILSVTQLDRGNEKERRACFGTYVCSDKNIFLAWGTGALINPWENFIFHISYEEMQIKPENESSNIGGFSFGIEYRF